LIEINFTLVIQLINFLILLVILNFLLFRPILRVLDEREKLVRDSSEIKERLNTLADEGIARYEEQLLNAKQEAMNIRTGVRSEVMGEFRKQVLEAKESGLEELEKSRREIAKEAEESRTVLMKEVESLGSRIASKLAGREL
jgi:F-type H+-transporting ATPase subunit b